MRADDGAADDAVRFRIEQQLGEALGAAVGHGAAGSGPREVALLDLDALGFRFVFRDAGPCHFRIRVGDRRDHLDVEVRLLAGSRFGGHVGFMHSLVRQHRLADQVADGEDVRHVGAHLAVDFDEAAVGDVHAGLVGSDLLAVRAAAHGDEHQVVDLRCRCRGTRFGRFERDLDAFRQRLDGDRLGLGHDVVEALLVELLPYLDGVAVSALHQAIHHFDHVDARAEGRINRRHFQADDAAADDQHAFRDLAQFQRARRIDDARVFRHERQLHHGRAGGDDGLLELHDFFRTVACRHFDVVRGEELAHSGDDLRLARLGHAGQAARHVRDHAFLVLAYLVDVDRRLGERHARVGHVRRFVDDGCHVQQRLGRDAAHVQAHAAQGGVALDDDRRHAQVGRAERRRIAARTAAKHHHVDVDVDLAVVIAGRDGGDRCRSRSGCRSGCRRCRSGSWRGSGRTFSRFHHQQRAAFGDLVADLDLDFLDDARVGRRNLHAGLVRFDRDQGLVHLDGVAHLDHQFDDFDFLEVADIRYFYLYCAHQSLLTAEFCACRPGLRRGTRRIARPSRHRPRGGRRTARCPSSGVAGRPCHPIPA
ncbi:hypothetical protein JAB9_46260 [Janthinobacterium sp. HH107]|nr:hypothetical protein JAB9_46260 [Janthinobacterium sp. HH107]